MDVHITAGNVLNRVGNGRVGGQGLMCRCEFRVNGGRHPVGQRLFLDSMLIAETMESIML